MSNKRIKPEECTAVFRSINDKTGGKSFYIMKDGVKVFAVDPSCYYDEEMIPVKNVTYCDDVNGFEAEVLEPLDILNFYGIFDIMVRRYASDAGKSTIYKNRYLLHKNSKNTGYIGEFIYLSNEYDLAIGQIEIPKSIIKLDDTKRMSDVILDEVRRSDFSLTSIDIVKIMVISNSYIKSSDVIDYVYTDKGIYIKYRDGKLPLLITCIRESTVAIPIYGILKYNENDDKWKKIAYIAKHSLLYSENALNSPDRYEEEIESPIDYAGNSLYCNKTIELKCSNLDEVHLININCLDCNEVEDFFENVLQYREGTLFQDLLNTKIIEHKYSDLTLPMQNYVDTLYGI